MGGLMQQEMTEYEKMVEKVAQIALKWHVGEANLDDIKQGPPKEDYIELARELLQTQTKTHRLAVVEREFTFLDNPYDKKIQDATEKQEEEYYIGCSNGFERLKGMILDQNWVREAK